MGSDYVDYRKLEEILKKLNNLGKELMKNLIEINEIDKEFEYFILDTGLTPRDISDERCESLVLENIAIHDEIEKILDDMGLELL